MKRFEEIILNQKEQVGLLAEELSVDFKKLLLSTFFVLGVSFPGVSMANPEWIMVTYSDFHSAYENLELFVEKLYQLKEQNPGKKIVLMANGDIFGASSMAAVKIQGDIDTDKGRYGMEVLAKLAKDFHIILNYGNHEGTDFSKVEGNRIIAEQIKYFNEVSRGIKITNANITPSAELRHAFQPFEDLRVGDRTTRFVGLLLDDFYNVSSYDRKSKDQPFEKIKRVKETVKDEIIRAARFNRDVANGRVTGGQPIHEMIFTLHLDHKSTMDLMEDINRWKINYTTTKEDKKADPLSKYVRAIPIPLAIASHDHLIKNTVTKSLSTPNGKPTRVVDSGSTGSHSVLGMGRNIVVQEQNEISKLKLPVIDIKNANYHDLIEEIRARVAEIRAQLNTMVNHTEGFNDKKADMAKGQTRFGQVIGDLLKEYALRVVEAKGIYVEPGAVLGLYNSSSYRRETIIQRGILTMGQILSIYPFPGSVGVFMVDGADFEKAMQEYHKTLTKAGRYSGQMSANLSWANDKPGSEIFVDGEPIVRSKKYAVAMDPWLTINGFNIPEFEPIMKGFVAKENFLDAALKMFRYKRLRLCKQSLSH